jgi:hypothetical protein
MTPCLFCGGDRSAPDHDQRCGRQGAKRVRKRIAETSRESFDQIRPELQAHHARTRAALGEFIAAFGFHPTSGELTDWLHSQGRAFDVNTVRPDLTRMKDSDHVRIAGKRICSHSGRKCYVWDLNNKQP